MERKSKQMVKKSEESKMQIQLLEKKSPKLAISYSYKQPISLQQVDPQISKAITHLTSQCPNNEDSDPSPLKAWFSFFYLNPFSKRSIMWSSIVMITIYLLELQISLELGFGPEFINGQVNNTGWFIILYYSLIAILILDVFFNFHKGFYAFGKGRVVQDTRQIVIRYLKFQFWLDCTNITILMILIPTNSFFLNFLQLVPACLLWVKKFNYQQQITQSLQYKKYARITFILGILAIDVVMIGNFGACIFVGIDLLLWRIQYYGNSCAYYWLCNDSEYSENLIDGPWGLQYTYAQSFSSGTLSTLAPGPFGKNPIQILYAIIVMTFFMFLASYVGEVLISILYYDNQKRVFHETNIQKFDEFMRLKQVSQEIKGRIHNFFQLIWEVQVKMDIQIKDQIISKLPINLKQKLLHQMSFTKNIDFLKCFPNTQTLQSLLTRKISQIIVDSETCIFSSAYRDSQARSRILYFVREGMAEFFIQNSSQNEQKILALSNIQKIIGCYEFITGQNYIFCCKAIELCIVDRIMYDDFIEIIRANMLQEQLHQLQENVLVQKKFGMINKRCIICLQQHREDQCSQIFLKFQIQQEIRVSGFNSKYKRQSFVRKNLKSRKVIGIGRTKKKVQYEQQKKDQVSSAFDFFKKFAKFTEVIFQLINPEQNIDQVYIFQKYRQEGNIASFRGQSSDI